MSVTKIEFEEKHHKIEVDGIEYEIPQRTPVIEDKIRKHDENIGKVSEYESNYSLLEILFGAESAKQMFPDRKTTNLDKLAKVTRVSISLFMTEFNKLQSNALKDSIDEIKPLLSAADKVEKLTSTKQTKEFVAKKRK